MSQWFSLISDWFQSKARAEEKAMKTFERLWNDQEEGHRVTFVSVVIQTSASSTHDIEDIGLSVWYKGSLSDNMSYHWHVQEIIEEPNTDGVTIFGKSDSFVFGKTQAIKPEDIQTVLDDWILSLSSRCEQLCLVMYGKQPIDILQRRWSPPSPVVLLDLEVLWRLRHGDQALSTLGEATSGTADGENDTAALHNAGNQAFHLLCMLRELGGNEAPRGTFFPELTDV